MCSSDLPIFQAAPVVAASKPEKSGKKEKPAKNKVKAAQSDSIEKHDDDSDARRGRRRRRGGRGRRKGQEESSSELVAVEENSEESANSHRRRRRRRGAEDGVQPGEIVDEDGVPTVVKVRESKERTERPERSERHDRNARRDRHHRREGRHREDRREYRETYRRRGTIITEGELLARRDEVKREMLVRQKGDRTQICVIEDGVMVEHYVNRNSSISYVGNVYLGKVQNVLPSMEAAFVDIGKGRNAVLYAGEVNWDAAGLEESAPRKKIGRAHV